jgi:outer membrane protein assembly factor BamB
MTSSLPDLHKLETATPRWRVDTGLPIMGTPALARVATSTVAIFGCGGRSASTGGIAVVEARTGKLVWQFDAAAGVEGGAAIDQSAENNARVYFGDQQGKLHCVDIDARREVWQAGLDGAIVAAPTLHKGRVIVGTGTGVVAWFDAQSGQLLGTERIQSQLVSAQPIHLPQEPRPTHDLMRELRTRMDELFSLDEIDLLFRDLGYDPDDLEKRSKEPRLGEILLYVQRRGRLPDLVMLCQKERPHIQWPTPGSLPVPAAPIEPAKLANQPGRQSARIVSSPIVMNVTQAEHIFVGALDGGVYRIVPSQAGITRVLDAGVALYAAPHASTNGSGHVLLAAHSGDIVVVDLVSGKDIWRVATGTPIRATPLLANGTIYAGTHGRTVHAFDLATGREYWKLPWHNSITTTPLLVQGRLIFGDTLGRVVCIDAATQLPCWVFDAQANKPGQNNLPAAVFGGFALHEGLAIFGAHNGCAYAIAV